MGSTAPGVHCCSLSGYYQKYQRSFESLKSDDLDNWCQEVRREVDHQIEASCEVRGFAKHRTYRNNWKHQTRLNSEICCRSVADHLEGASCFHSAHMQSRDRCRLLEECLSPGILHHYTASVRDPDVYSGAIQCLDLERMFAAVFVPVGFPCSCNGSGRCQRCTQPR